MTSADPVQKIMPILGTEGRAKIGVAQKHGHYQSEAARTFLESVKAYYRSLPNSIAEINEPKDNAE